MISTSTRRGVAWLLLLVAIVASAELCIGAEAAAPVAPIEVPAALYVTSDTETKSEEVQRGLAAEARERGERSSAAPLPVAPPPPDVALPAIAYIDPAHFEDGASDASPAPAAKAAGAPSSSASSEGRDRAHELLRSEEAQDAAVLTEEEMRAVLARTSWPPAWHGRVLAIARCESGLEVRQQRGDGGLAWGLLSIRVDVHTHLTPVFDVLTAWGNLEAGWRVFSEREAIGWSGWDAWYVCSRRAA